MNSKRVRVLIISSMVLLLNMPYGYCLPQVSEVVAGNASLEYPDVNTLKINAADNTIINYTSFDIGANESVIVSLPAVNNEILNRVLQGNASQILGSLSCNGIFILVNQSGIYFGPNANVDVASLIASTRDITNSNFLDSNYVFGRLSKDEFDSLLVNQGKINIREGGFGVLIAGAIENEGTIVAPLGQVALAGGDLIKIDISNNGLISVAIDEPVASTILDKEGNPITDQIKNTGKIEARGGTVLLKAEALTDVFEKAINLEGYLYADKVVEKDGLIKIVSTGDIRLNADLRAERIEVSGPQEAVAKNIQIDGGTLLAKDTTLEAEKVILAGGEPTYLYGDITFYNLNCTVPDKEIYFEEGKLYTFRGDTYIKGVPGYEGLIKLLSSEKGSPWYSDFSGSGDIDITYVALRDAHNISDAIKVKPSTNWGNCVGWDTDPDWSGQGSTLYWSEPFNWDTQTVPTQFDDVAFMGNINLYPTANKDSIIDTNSYGGTTPFGGTIASLTIDGYQGTITQARALKITKDYQQTSGTFYSPELEVPLTFHDFSVARSFSIPGGKFRRFGVGSTIVADIWGLQAMNNDLAEDYLLGNDIDASATANWNAPFGFVPVGNNANRFTGTFDGQGYTITDLFINRAATNRIGLFGMTQGASIEDVGLVSVNITGQDRVGALVGHSAFTSSIIRSYSTGTVAGVQHVGGLVGFNGNNDPGGAAASITNSYSTVNATGTGWNTGGLVGRNEALAGTTSRITNCYATGSVTGTDPVNSDFIGGLIGQTDARGSITNCYATGAVSSNNGGANIGGLVGFSELAAVYTTSYWIQNGAATGLGNMADPAGVIEEARGADAFYGSTHAVYGNWDFGSIWDAFDTAYPRLQWETEDIVITPEVPEQPEIVPPEPTIKLIKIVEAPVHIVLEDLAEIINSKYEKRYLSGTYRTIVIVFDGIVIVAPYVREGVDWAKGVVLTEGEQTSQEAKIE